MATLNEEAKLAFIQKIINALPKESFICANDKKYYFWENGVQIAVTLTCPKIPYGGNSEDSTYVEVMTPPSVEFTADEKANVEKLMAALGL